MNALKIETPDLEMDAGMSVLKYQERPFNL